MYNVIFLSTLLSKVGRLKRPAVAVGQEQQLHPAAGLQPPSLPSIPPRRAGTCACRKHGSDFGKVGK